MMKNREYSTGRAAGSTRSCDEPPLWGGMVEVACHFCRERPYVDRLGDITVEARGFCPSAVLRHRVSGEGHDLPGPYGQTLQLLQHREPVPPGKLDVEQDERRRRLLRARDLGYAIAVGEADHLMALQRQERRQQFQTVGLVLDHDDRCHAVS